jgi:hypothetical protein
MSETLCEGEPSSLSSTARLKRRSLATTAARAGGADPSRTKGSATTERGICRDGNDYEQLLYIQQRDDAHNSITFIKKHIMCLILCFSPRAAEAT